MLKGINISETQGMIDWNLVKPNIDFVMICCGYGDNLIEQDDQQFENNVSSCEKLEIPYAVCLYSHANTLDKVNSEIQHALRLLKDKNPFCVYCVMEDVSVIDLGVDQLTNYICRFGNEIEQAGYKFGVFANEDWFKNYLDIKTLRSLGYSICIKKYSDSKPKFSVKKGEYDIWEYSSEGQMDGIVSPELNMSYMYNDIRIGVTNNKDISPKNLIDSEPPKEEEIPTEQTPKKEQEPLEEEVPTKQENPKKPEVPKEQFNPTPSIPLMVNYDSGKKIILKEALLYVTANSKKNISIKTGTYYLWNSEIINNRIRITETAFDVEKAGKVFGWVDISDIK